MLFLVVIYLNNSKVVIGFHITKLGIIRHLRNAPVVKSCKNFVKVTAGLASLGYLYAPEILKNDAPEILRNTLLEENY